MAPRRALICGVSGQDGSYLAQLLLAKGYEVWGTSRDASACAFANLEALGIRNEVEAVTMPLVDQDAIQRVISLVRPHEIYNLAGQSSVGLSFELPIESIESIVLGTQNLLNAIRRVDPDVRLFNAGSGECFGDTHGVPATETSPFSPKSPYAIAKAAAAWQVALYREAYGFFACTGFLFNHESPLRPNHFVSQRIVNAARRIAHGGDETLTLGNIDIRRDWGWAPEYVEVMWKMLQMSAPTDYVIATGRTVPLRYFVERVFENFGLDWLAHTVVDKSLFRPSDVASSEADPSRAKQDLDWEAKFQVESVVELLCVSEPKSFDVAVK